MNLLLVVAGFVMLIMALVLALRDDFIASALVVLTGGGLITYFGERLLAKK
ncbi:MAG: hypothetical protein K2Y29_19135 [Beijerinckiaceae bacterium]|nr:hypothetical protein [Beijerinckiaceae bacterium]